MWKGTSRFFDFVAGVQGNLIPWYLTLECDNKLCHTVVLPSRCCEGYCWFCAPCFFWSAGQGFCNFALHRKTNIDWHLYRNCKTKRSLQIVSGWYRCWMCKLQSLSDLSRFRKWVWSPSVVNCPNLGLDGCRRESWFERPQLIFSVCISVGSPATIPTAPFWKYSIRVLAASYFVICAYWLKAPQLIIIALSFEYANTLITVRPLPYYITLIFYIFDVITTFFSRVCLKCPKLIDVCVLVRPNISTPSTPLCEFLKIIFFVVDEEGITIEN